MPEAYFVLLGAGLAAGFVAGLAGVGGGIIFAPVLLFYFSATGVTEPHLAPLTVGTSLLCTLIASSASAYHHYRRGVVRKRIAGITGTASAVAVVLVSSFVTTQPWYDKRSFQLVFGVVLAGVAIHMIRSQPLPEVELGAENNLKAKRRDTLAIGSVGTVAGAISSAIGVGGGIVLVPAFHRLLRLPIHVAVGTSSATIIIISLLGVLTYVVLGSTAASDYGTTGYVDLVTGILLSVPALITARLGVMTAHRFEIRTLKIGFAILALIVAIRLTFRALAA